MNTDKALRDLSLLAARLTLGASIAAHGSQKMFGAFGGPGIEGVSQGFSSMGFEPGERYARAASMAEIGSGTLIALGALGPVGPAMLISVMITAIETAHRPKGFWAANGGYELNVMYMLGALLLATEGYGSLSVDALLGIHKKTNATLGWLALAGGAVAAAIILGQRNMPQQQSSQQRQKTTEKNEVETRATAS